MRGAAPSCAGRDIWAQQRNGIYIYISIYIYIRLVGHVLSEWVEQQPRQRRKVPEHQNGTEFICIYLYLYLSIYLSIYIYISIRICIHRYTYIWIYWSTSTSIYVCMYVYMYVCIYLSTNIYSPIHLCIYIRPVGHILAEQVEKQIR